jgi:hypothetical protein
LCAVVGAAAHADRVILRCTPIGAFSATAAVTFVGGACGLAPPNTVDRSTGERRTLMQPTARTAFEWLRNFRYLLSPSIVAGKH